MSTAYPAPAPCSADIQLSHGAIRSTELFPQNINMAAIQRSFLALLLLILHVKVDGYSPTSPRALQRGRSVSSNLAGRIETGDDDTSRYVPSYLATCIPGCAAILADELVEVGCWDVQQSGKSAVTFTADTATALRALLWTRSCHKMMELLCQSVAPITNRDDLYQFVRKTVDVEDLLGNDEDSQKGQLLTIAVQTIMNAAQFIPPDINHSHYTALTVKNAIADACIEWRGDRPDVNLDDPDVPLVCSVLGTPDSRGAVVSIFRQLHPAGTLHKRGYRFGNAIHKAAMKESMAAALLLHTGWPLQCRIAKEGNGDPVILIDPMAGSGSLLLEAACIAADIAPGLMRIKTDLPGHRMPPVTRWKSDGGKKGRTAESWRELLVEATTRARGGLQWMQSSGRIQIIGNDIHPGALDLFESALNQSGLSHVVQVAEGDCLDWKPVTSSAGPWMVVSNPPWDVRLTGDMHEAWEALRVFLRETCPPGTQAWVLSGNPAATKHLGLRKSEMLPLKAGQVDLRWIQYAIRDKNAPVVEGGESDRSFHSEERKQRHPSVRSSKPTGREPKDADNAWLIN